MAEKQGQTSQIITLTDTTTSEALTQISADEIALRGAYDTLAFSMALAGGSAIALDQFELQVRFVGGGAWNNWIKTWTTLQGVLRGVVPVEDLATLAHGSTRYAIIDVRGVYSARFLSAQAAVTASPVTRTLIATVGKDL